MWEEQFGFRPRHSMSLQLARLVERITRNFGEKRLIGPVFLDVAKAFDTDWIDGLLYKLTHLKFPAYIVQTISSYLQCRTFKAFFQMAISSRRGMQVGVAQGGLISPLLFSVYVNDVPCRVSPPRRWHSHYSHVPQTNTARQLPGVIPQRPSMVVEGMEITINASKSTAIIFARAGRRLIQTWPITFFEEPIQWVNTSYLG